MVSARLFRIILSAFVCFQLQGFQTRQTTTVCSFFLLSRQCHDDEAYSEDRQRKKLVSVWTLDPKNGERDEPLFGLSRRNLVSGLLSAQTLLSSVSNTHAAAPSAFMARLLEQKLGSLYVVSPRLRNTTTATSLKKNQEALKYLSRELALLKLLPVRNDREPVFRGLQGRLEGISFALADEEDPSGWARARSSLNETISFLDSRRDQLAPVFNQEDSTMLAINKGEQGELRIEALRTLLVDIEQACQKYNSTLTYQKQRQALLALAEVGELLVATFPYDVPSEGKFSYLPRLLGRARVTFTFRRKDKILGNVTILADGFTAPITAGNFVDLSVRNFYTGLPVQNTKKRLQKGSDFDVANLPVFGSFNEGFYDPLTAKLRRIPLEIIRVEKSNNVPSLSYSQGLSGLTTSTAAVNLEPTSYSKPLLSFTIPGLVAMNHPDKNIGGGSSEFFCLRPDSLSEESKRLLDGEYAPFGYIVQGLDLFNQLQPGDVIDSTVVDEWGLLNLVKIRQSRFSEVVQGEDETLEGNDT